MIAVSSSCHQVRRGITLLEVLIAIGILAIGLSSVVAILPAAKSQATRAVILDRAAGLAANILADAATFGLLRDDAMSLSLGPNQIGIIDPAVPLDAYAPPVIAIATPTQPLLRRAGIFSTTTTASVPVDYQRLFTDGRDDVLLGESPTPDDLPTHLFVDGARGYQGRMTALLALLPPDPAATPPRLGRVSAVVFHNRDTSIPVLQGQLNGVVLTLNAIPPGRTFRDLVKPGSVIFDGARFRQLKSAAIHETGGATSAFVTLSSASPGGPISLFPDSVGLAERFYTPEVNGAFLR